MKKKLICIFTFFTVFYSVNAQYSTTNRITDWNTIWKSGFYEASQGANQPLAGYDWYWGINIAHSGNNDNYRYNGQILIANKYNSPAMFFRSTSNDGVGTWAQLIHNLGNQQINGSLGVKGTLTAKEIIVTNTGWADFVFDKDYQLPSLKEVEEHICEKGYLPGIPPASEVKENGVNLNEINVKLLQKIEELTLYTIQQQKMIESMQAKIAKLESK